MIETYLDGECAFLYIFLYIKIRWASSAARTDIPDPLSPLFSIVHRLQQVFWTTSRIFK